MSFATQFRTGVWYTDCEDMVPSFLRCEEMSTYIYNSDYLVCFLAVQGVQRTFMIHRWMIYYWKYGLLVDDFGSTVFCLLDGYICFFFHVVCAYVLCMRIQMDTKTIASDATAKIPTSSVLSGR